MYIAVIAHLGKDYVTEYEGPQQVKSIEERCECCGDGDSVLGPYKTKEEANEAISSYYSWISL